MSDDRLIQSFRRLMTVIGRGKVKILDDSGVTQQLQVDLGPTGPDGSLEIHDNLPNVAIYGFSGAPPVDSDIIVLFIGGDRNRAIGIGVNHQASRLTGLSPGDSAQYDVRGAFLKFVAGGPVLDAAGGNVTVQNAGTITIEASAEIVLNAPSVKAIGTMTVTGDLTVQGTFDP